MRPADTQREALCFHLQVSNLGHFNRAHHWLFCFLFFVWRSSSGQNSRLGRKKWINKNISKQSRIMASCCLNGCDGIGIAGGAKDSRASHNGIATYHWLPNIIHRIQGPCVVHKLQTGVMILPTQTKALNFKDKSIKITVVIIDFSIKFHPSKNCWVQWSMIPAARTPNPTTQHPSHPSPASLISLAFLPLAPPSISIHGSTPFSLHIFFKSLWQVSLDPGARHGSHRKTNGTHPNFMFPMVLVKWDPQFITSNIWK